MNTWTEGHDISSRSGLARRKLLVAAGTAGLALLAGCTTGGSGGGSAGSRRSGSATDTTPRPVTPSAATGGTPGSGLLICYFSWSGNTRRVTQFLHADTGAPVFEILPQKPYSGDYDATVDQARAEQGRDARPALRSHVQNLSSYRTVFLGFPDWWGTMPMLLFTFLEEHDLAGKTLIPFCTHGGSGLGRSEDDIAKLAPHATRRDGLAITGTETADSHGDVTSWVKGLGSLV